MAMAIAAAESRSAIDPGHCGAENLCGFRSVRSLPGETLNLDALVMQSTQDWRQFTRTDALLARFDEMIEKRKLCTSASEPAASMQMQEMRRVHTKRGHDDARQRQCA